MLTRILPLLMLAPLSACAGQIAIRVVPRTQVITPNITTRMDIYAENPTDREIGLPCDGRASKFRYSLRDENGKWVQNEGSIGAMIARSFKGTSLPPRWNMTIKDYELQVSTDAAGKTLAFKVDFVFECQNRETRDNLIELSASSPVVFRVRSLDADDLEALKTISHGIVSQQSDEARREVIDRFPLSIYAGHSFKYLVDEFKIRGKDAAEYLRHFQSLELLEDNLRTREICGGVDHVNAATCGPTARAHARKRVAQMNAFLQKYPDFEDRSSFEWLRGRFCLIADDRACAIESFKWQAEHADEPPHSRSNAAEIVKLLEAASASDPK